MSTCLIFESITLMLFSWDRYCASWASAAKWPETARVNIII